MKFSDTIQFSWRLLRSKWARNLLVFCALMLGNFFLALFFSFSQGLKEHILSPLQDQLDAEVLIVKQRVSGGFPIFNPLKFFESQAEQGIDPEFEEQIREFPEVAEVYPETRIPFPVATSANIILNFNFSFDSTLSGFPEDVMREYISEEKTFSGDEEVMPIVISPLLVELYNSTLVEVIPGAERRTLDDFVGKTMEFRFGEINYLKLLYRFPEDVDVRVQKAEIVGFAPFLSPFTFGIPEKTARSVRVEYEEIAPEDINPRSLLVRPRSTGDIDGLKERLDEIDFFAHDLSENFAMLSMLFWALQVVLVFAASAIVLVAMLFLMSVLFMGVMEYRQNIGILRSLGASEGSIVRVFLLQGMLLTFVSTVLGFAGALAIADALNSMMLSRMPTFAIQFEGLFYFDAMFFLQIFGVIMVISALVSWIPARKASKLTPIETILKL